MPIAIPRVRALTYLRTMDQARTRPCVFSCGGTDGQYQEYVVKPLAVSAWGVVCEFLAALVGRHLGLPIPPFAVVDVDPRIVQAIPDRGARPMPSGQGPYFGSLFVSGGFFPPPPGLALPVALIPKAMEIFAFDMLIQNPDRTGASGQGNPNLLWNGDEFVIFDHEQAFCRVLDAGWPQSPWLMREWQFARKHLFREPLARHADRHELPFVAFPTRVAGLSDVILSDMRDAVPQEWDHPETCDRIVTHLRAIRDDPALFERSLREVLT